MSNSLLLSDLLARSVAVEWYEAVAIVRGVTDRLLEGSGTHIVPDLHQIELAASGTISVSGGVMTDDPVRRLGQLLQAAISQSEPPVQLRLFVAQTTAATPAFDSVGEFSTALGYFERPNRVGVLQAIYDRAAITPAPPGSPFSPTLDAIAPLQPEPWDLPSKKRATHPALWLTLAVVLLVVAGTAAYVKFGGVWSKTHDVGAIALKASDAVGSAVVSGISSVTERAGLGRLAPSNSAGTVPAAPAPVEVAATPTIAPKPTILPRKAGIPTVIAFDLEPSQSVIEEAVVVAAPPAPPAALPGAPEAMEKTPTADLTIYSAASPSVAPPMGIRPQLPRELPANVDKSQLGRIELVVLPDGTVGSVKLLDHPHNVHEAMFLSAVKAWEFRPAMKDGRPVSFRKTIWMAFQQ